MMHAVSPEGNWVNFRIFPPRFEFLIRVEDTATEVIIQ